MIDFPFIFCNFEKIACIYYQNAILLQGFIPKKYKVTVQQICALGALSVRKHKSEGAELLRYKIIYRRFSSEKAA